MLRNYLILALFSLLTACGGGGGGGGGGNTAGGGAGGNTTESAKTFPFAQTIADFIAASHAYNFTAAVDLAGIDLTGAGTISYGATVADTFEGQLVLKSVNTVEGTFTDGITTLPYAITVQAYYNTDYTPLGTSSPGEYCVADSSSSYPATVEVGDTGVIGEFTCYADDTKSLVLSYGYLSYLIEKDTADTAIVNMILTEKNTANVVQLTDQDRYRIDELGGIGWVSETVTDHVDNTVMVFTAE